VLTVAHEGMELDGDEVEINTQEIHIDKQGNIKAFEDAQKDGAKSSPAKKGAENKPPEPPKPAAPPLPPPPPPIPKQEPSAPPQTAQKLPEPPSAQATSTFGLPVSQQAMPPLPPNPPLEDELPPLPPPSPPPAIKMDAHTTAIPPAAKAAPSPTDAPDETNNHVLLDPMQRAPGIGAPFSADTTQGLGSPGVNVDPVNNGASNGQGEFAIHSKVIKPPEEHLTPLDQLLAAQNSGGLPVPPPASAPASPPPTAPTAAPQQNDLTPDGARQAVENAYASAPFNPDLNPTAAVGAHPVVELHQPPAPAQDATPSLNLPGGPTPPPPSATASPQAAPPPPPMPPPIMPQDPNSPINTPYGPMPPPSL
jgi:tRNA pseudouridine55 synthase